MPEEEISARVKRFIQRTISSVDQLEILLFLMSNAERSWTSAEAAARLHISTDVATVRMHELVGADLVSQSEEEPSAFRYAPGSSALEREVATSLQEAYLERRDSVLQLIYSRPLDHVRIFADAFRIRRDE